MSSDNSLVEKPTKAADKKTLGFQRGPLPSSDADIERIENVPGDVSLVEPKLKQKRTRRLKRHFARFWLCYCFWNVIFLAIFLPIFFLVVIPAIAQLVVNKSTLLLVNAEIMNPHPDWMILSLEAALDLPIAFPVRIDPLLLSIYDHKAKGNDTIFKANIDGTMIHGNTTLGFKDRYTPVDVDLWTNYVHQVVFEKNAPLPVKGETNAYLGILKSHVKVDKDIHQKSLNKFEGFSITNPSIDLYAEKGTNNLVANATLPNAGVLHLQIGTTFLDLKSGNYTIGNATIDDLVLLPGNNTVAVNGIIDLEYLIDNLKGILEGQSDALNRGALRLSAVGRSVVFDGEEVPYYTDAMKDLTLSADVSLASLLRNTLHGALHPNGTSILANLTSSSSGGSSSIHDIINNIDDPDGSLGLNKTSS
ncbi:hypothetical protein BDV18DRAFT_3421 [Aspergillus unguis]